MSGWWQIPPQHQSTYLGGPESASIEIPPFGPFLWSKFSKMKIFKKFRIAPKFFFALQYIKNWTKVVHWTTFFCSWKKIVSLKKTSFEILWSGVWKGGFQLMLILGLLGMYFDAAVVFVTSQTLLFRLALAILWPKIWILKGD